MRTPAGTRRRISAASSSVRSKRCRGLLLVGTGLVTLLYVALNYVFLSVAPIADMTGQLEVGFIAAQAAFGEQGGASPDWCWPRC